MNAYVTTAGLDPFTIDPPDAVAIRDDSYKLVRNTYIPNVPAGQSYEACSSTAIQEFEFYLIDELPPVPLIDKDGPDGRELDIQNLDPEAQASYDALLEQLTRLQASQPVCNGDGNGDLVVDRKDLRDYRKIVRGGGLSSHYGFNVDGLTNDVDRAVIEANLGNDCHPVP